MVAIAPCAGGLHFELQIARAIPNPTHARRVFVPVPQTLVLAVVVVGPQDLTFDPYHTFAAHCLKKTDDRQCP